MPNKVTGECIFAHFNQSLCVFLKPSHWREMYTLERQHSAIFRARQYSSVSFGYASISYTKAYLGGQMVSEDMECLHSIEMYPLYKTTNVKTAICECPVDTVNAVYGGVLSLFK